MKKNGILLIGALLLPASNLPAQTTAWLLDKAHSQVRFSVSHMVIAELIGRFTDFDVTLKSDKDDFTDAVIEAKIRTGSINTDNERRDNHLKSDDFLNAEKYPEMIFKSGSIEKTGPKAFKIAGDLTIRDITKAVVLDTKFAGTIVDPSGNTKAGFKATTTINRFEFGTKWNRLLETGGLVAGEDVEVTLVMEFMKQKEGK